MTVPADRRHVVIQKRRGHACQFCRIPMDPAGELAQEECGSRPIKPGRGDEVDGLAALKRVGKQMTGEPPKKKRTKKAR